MYEGQPEIEDENIENSEEENEELLDENTDNSEEEGEELSDENIDNSEEEPEELPEEDVFDEASLFPIDIRYLRTILNIDPDAVSDKNLEGYANLVRSRVLAKISSVMDLEDIEKLPDHVLQLIEETIMAGIACHIAMVDPTILYTPTDYKVGDVEEEFSDKFYDKVPSWCEYYNGLLDDLLDEIRPKGHLLTYKRRGLSYHRGWYHRV